MTNILTGKECDFEIANLYYEKIQNEIENKYCVFKDQSQLFLVSGNDEQLYLLHRK